MKSILSQLLLRLLKRAGLKLYMQNENVLIPVYMICRVLLERRTPALTTKYRHSCIIEWEVVFKGMNQIIRRWVV